MIKHYNFIISGTIIEVTADSLVEAKKKANDLYMLMKQENLEKHKKYEK